MKPRTCPHKLLKEVEFVGFDGNILDTELVMYIVENAPNLEKMVFDCRSPASYLEKMVLDCRTPGSDHFETLRRERAREFTSMFGPAVNFVLIP